MAEDLQMANPPPEYRMNGWIRDTPDVRDQSFSTPISTLKTLPPVVDLRGPLMPDIYNQGAIGSCTANAVGAMVQFVRRKWLYSPDFPPSRLFLYYGSREREQTIALDNGAQLRTTVKVAAKLGVCDEMLWPYDAEAANSATHLFPATSRAVQRPADACFDAADDHQAIAYWRIPQSLSQLRGCLAEGFPFVFGFTVYSSFNGSDGRPLIEVPLPDPDDELLGHHAVAAVGYDDAANQFIVRNSWGATVHDGGYFRMPYAFLTDTGLAADFWTIRQVEA